jgi:3'-phosphoadenosine 5'-phosphosulfate sulfotransferase (PAPS reductase)/FAD synthetase
MIILSCSGGKDSTAAGLLLKERGLDFSAIFCDTGWEAPETYAYLRDVLPATLGQIRWLTPEVRWPDRLPLLTLRASGADAATIEAEERAEAARVAVRCESYAQEIEALIGVPFSAFVRVALKKGVLPSRLLRWCTQELKAIPAKRFLSSLDSPLNVVGIRAEESPSRALMPEREYDAAMDCDVWRPIIGWTLAEVIAIHQRHGLRPNPLYLGSAVRVGCYPCIFARKAEIADLSPARIAAIRLLEQRVAELSRDRIERKGERVVRLPPTFFQAEKPLPDGSYHQPIDSVMEWAKTGRGGRQYELFASGRDEGCMRWGLCNTARDRRVRVKMAWHSLNYRPRAAKLDPYRHLFGVVSDREIARRAGVSPSVVWQMRQRSGVMAAGQSAPRI